MCDSAQTINQRWWLAFLRRRRDLPWY